MTIKDIKKEYFKLINSKGEVSKKIYKKEYFERSSKKYCISDVEDINSFRFIKSTQLVTIEFEY